MADFQVPVDANIDWGAVNHAIGIADKMREREDQSRIAAIRYQGQREYEDLVKAGVDSTEAIRRTAPKLYFQSPALAQVMRATAPQKPVPVMRSPEATTLGGQAGYINYGATGAPRFTPMPRTPAVPADPGETVTRSVDLAFARKQAVDADTAFRENQLSDNPEVPGTTMKWGLQGAFPYVKQSPVPNPTPLTKAAKAARVNLIEVARGPNWGKQPSGAATMPDPSDPSSGSVLPSVQSVIAEYKSGPQTRQRYDEAQAKLKALGVK